MLAIVEFEILSKGPHPDPATSVLVARAEQRQARVRFATRVSWVEAGERLGDSRHPRNPACLCIRDPEAILGARREARFDQTAYGTTRWTGLPEIETCHVVVSFPPPGVS